MKRLFALLLALLLCCGYAFGGYAPIAAAETENEASEETDAEKDEHETAGIGYIDPVKQFYIVVPVSWTAIGRGSSEQNLNDAAVILAGSADVDELYAAAKDRNLFIAMGAEMKSGMVLTFGSNEYVSNTALLDDIDEVKQSIKETLPGVKFVEADCGAYSFRSLENILRLHMVYETGDIDQYYLITGETMYIFTFLNATEEEKNAVFYFFKTGVSEFDKQ